MPPRKSSSRAATARTPSAKARLDAAEQAVRSISLDRDEPFSSLNPCVNEIVPPSSLANLKDYKYSVLDHSVMQKYIPLHRFWEYCVSFVPYYVAPNLLTFTAMICSMSYPLLIMYFEFFTEKGVEGAPNWIWLFSAVMLFLYHTLDAMDGKHARRSKCGSPLGEECDHGCDMISAPFMIYASCRSQGWSESQNFVFTLLMSFGAYTTILEQFLSGTFVLGHINGPTEGNFLSFLFFILTFALGGPSFWKTELKTPWIYDLPKTFLASTASYNSNISSQINFASTYGDVLFVVFFLLAFGTVLGMARNCATKLTSSNPAKNLVAGLDVNNTLKHYIVHVAIFLTWGLFAWRHGEKSAYKYWNKFFIVYGIYFSYAANNMSVQRLCKLPAYLSWKMIALVVAIPLTKLIRGEGFCVGCYAVYFAALMFGSYLFWLTSVFHQFARGLGINVLTLTDKQMEISLAEDKKRRGAGKD